MEDTSNTNKSIRTSSLLASLTGDNDEGLRPNPPSPKEEKVLESVNGNDFDFSFIEPTSAPPQLPSAPPPPIPPPQPPSPPPPAISNDVFKDEAMDESSETNVDVTPIVTKDANDENPFNKRTSIDDLLKYEMESTPITLPTSDSLFHDHDNDDTKEQTNEVNGTKQEESTTLSTLFPPDPASEASTPAAIVDTVSPMVSTPLDPLLQQDSVEEIPIKSERKISVSSLLQEEEEWDPKKTSNTLPNTTTAATIPSTKPSIDSLLSLNNEEKESSTPSTDSLFQNVEQSKASLSQPPKPSTLPITARSTISSSPTKTTTLSSTTPPPPSPSTKDSIFGTNSTEENEKDEPKSTTPITDDTNQASTLNKPKELEKSPNRIVPPLVKHYDHLIMSSSMTASFSSPVRKNDTFWKDEEEEEDDDDDDDDSVEEDGLLSNLASSSSVPYMEPITSSPNTKTTTPANATPVEEQIETSNERIEDAASTLFQSLVPPSQKDKPSPPPLHPTYSQTPPETQDTTIQNKTEERFLFNNETPNNGSIKPSKEDLFSSLLLPTDKNDSNNSSGKEQSTSPNANMKPASVVQISSETSKKTNSLAQSGLLSSLTHTQEIFSSSSILTDIGGGSGDGGGLFDEIDAEEERKRLAEEERKRKELERKRLEEEERKRKELERKRLEEERERKRLLEEERQRRLRREQELREKEERERQEAERQKMLELQKKEEEDRRRREEEAIMRRKAELEELERRRMERSRQDALTTGTATMSAISQISNGNNLHSGPIVSNVAPPPAPPSSFYRTHEPQIIMDDPLSSFVTNNDNTYNNMTGRYDNDGDGANPLKSLQQPQQQQQQPQPQSQPGHSTPHYTQAQLPASNSYQQRSLEKHQAVNTATIPPSNFTQEPPSPLAGNYNSQPSKEGSTPNISNTKSTSAGTLFSAPSPDFDPIFGDILVNEPRLMTTPGLFGSTPPHWTYNVSTLPKQGHSGSVICVRRRFRHFVALEERLRDACPGSILPPRPDKHEGRIIEEGLQQQSPAFAAARATELQTYLNNLAHHPYAGTSEPFRLFLELQDHIGNAWPEVSSNAFTRLGQASSKTAVKVATSTNNAFTLNQHVAEMGEDNAELLALATSEHLRLTALVQAVLKIEGFIHQIREFGDRRMFTGLETSRLLGTATAPRNLTTFQERHPELYVPLSLLATGFMKGGKRTKHLSLQLSAAFGPFIMEYRQSHNERMAFHGRRTLLLKREAARSKAAEKSAKLVFSQRQMQMSGNFPRALEQLEYEASLTDKIYTEIAKETEENGKILAGEVTRLTQKRQREWMTSLKVMASGFKEASAESCAIWMSLKRDMQELLPETQKEDRGGVGGYPGNAQIPRVGMGEPMVASMPTPLNNTNLLNSQNNTFNGQGNGNRMGHGAVGATVVAIPGLKTMSR